MFLNSRVLFVFWCLFYLHLSTWQTLLFQWFFPILYMAERCICLAHRPKRSACSGTGKSLIHLLLKPESCKVQWHNTSAQISALTHSTNYPYIKIRAFIKRRKSESNTASTISSHYPAVKRACSLDIFLPPGSGDLSRTFQPVKAPRCCSILPDSRVDEQHVQYLKNVHCLIWKHVLGKQLESVPALWSGWMVLRCFAPVCPLL